MLLAAVREFFRVDVGNRVEISGEVREVIKVKRKFLAKGNIVVSVADEGLINVIDTLRAHSENIVQ